MAPSLCPPADRGPSHRYGHTDGDLREHANYFDVNVYGASADSVGRYTHKGSRVGVDGRLEWREWETDDQQRRQAVSIVDERVQFLDGPGEGRAQGSSSELDGGGEDADERELVGAGAQELDVTF